ncbi:phospholipase C [Cupriavidus sp. YR651]|uniref:phosphocholine-specific phospholipase C n=1 Tax=Cupriavidus sp. YR651 TaxID=1855315 RepID=UPI00088A3574|nr:phospholipase C, phosphocholine-specific [Cupriavidus sp. YR651]SDD86416.1 phospholipase C [Cupriavidus sp. YR651]
MPDRRHFLRAGVAAAGLTALPPAIRRALAIPASRRTGTLRDVEHVVILMMENRSFDHYFGTLPGVRGFADRFPIPVPDAPGLRGKTVWYQRNDADPARARTLAPFRLDTTTQFALMRVTGTPHTWSNAQDAWSGGRMDRWPTFKHDHSLAYYTEADLPFQFALARAFTVCDAYHASFTGGTNTNRLFLWGGTNDPDGRGNGPALGNTYNKLEGGDPRGGYTWTTYPERLQAAGVSWQIYQDTADNYSLNPLAGFRKYRDAMRAPAGDDNPLRARALTTRGLDLLRADVIAGRLPQVSWICPTRRGSEHPGPSSPAQGADYVAAALDALTANPEVWSRTALLVMFDENDGFFDHLPPPAPPAYETWHANPARARLAGESTVDTRGEYHRLVTQVEKDDTPAYLHHSYGLGPRVPMYVISPWSKGGWVNSEVFDHTSVIRFLEQRFGVEEPNITPWRRAVCGDLTSAFDFAHPDTSDHLPTLPATAAQAARARALPATTTPPAPALPTLPTQASGTRPSRTLPYHLHADARTTAGGVTLRLENAGRAGAVIHVYDRLHLDRGPRRYTIEAGKSLTGQWDCDADDGRYDLWLLGPNGWHRHISGTAPSHTGQPGPVATLRHDPARQALALAIGNTGGVPCRVRVQANAYGDASRSIDVAPGQDTTVPWPLGPGGWYDVSVIVPESSGFTRRFAGRMETGAHATTDPAQGGQAIGDQWPVSW